ncbi:MAG: VOC family protein, partial [Actinomycetes bacterium]
MGVATRLRQVALVAGRLGPVADRLRQELDLGPPYHDPGIIGFGLENAVFAVGDTFIEVVAPVRPETAAGRYLDRQGGDGGYMAIFQVPDMAAARRRVDELGIRVVYRADHADIAGTHLHPKDVPGAIVSLDWADPAGTWRWAGPDWTGQVPDHPAGGITTLTVRARYPTALGQRWAEVLATDSRPDGPDTIIVLDDGRQALRFASCGPAEPEGISGVEVAIPTQAGARRRSVEIG